MKKIVIFIFLILTMLTSCNNEEHIHQYKEEKVEATCIDKGYTKYTCECGDEYTDNYVDALGHKELIIEAIDPTCDKDGSAEGKVCSLCHEVFEETEVIASIGHAYGEVTYKWSEDHLQVTATRVCANDESHIETETVSATYSVVTKETCEEDGYTTYTCECGDEYTDNYVDALGHKELIIEAIDPTCDKDGLTVGKVCSLCQKVLVKQEVVKALGHAYSEVIYKWSEDHLQVTATRVCANDESHIETETVSATYSVVTKETCEEDGLGKYTSESFNNSAFDIQEYEEVIKAIGHNYTSVVISPTCEEDGYTAYTCKCGDEYTNNHVDALGHIFINYVSDDNATKEQDGTKTAVCDRDDCDNTDVLVDEYSKFAKVSYTAFGDSITYGIDGVDWGKMANPYPTLVSNALGLKSLDNQGVSGATYCVNNLNRTNMTARILSYSKEADIISLMLGVNDCYVGLPLGDETSKDNTTIYGSLYLIANYLTTNYSDSFIFFMTPFKMRGYEKNNSQNYKLEDVANAIKYVANKYNIPVLDLFENGNYEVEMYLPVSDGIHPSQGFFIEYTGPQITEFIKENYRKIEYTKFVDYSELSFTAFGDSITYGADLIIGGRVETPYPTEVSNILGLKSYSNMGVSGATLTTNNQGLHCMTNIITSYTEDADIIGVLGGVNDFNRNLPLGDINDKDTSTIYGALHVGMSYLSENYSDSFIFYMTPYKEDFGGNFWSTDNSAGYNLVDVSNAIKEVAKIYNIAVLDLLEDGNFESIMYDSDCDGIHPNQAFISNVMAPQIAHFIKDNYNK